MMTCFTPSPINANHVHFIDGALGGYTTAAIALKAELARRRCRCPALASIPPCQM